MMRSYPRRRSGGAVLIVAVVGLSMTGCSGFRGVNSLPLPGTEGDGKGAYTVFIQMPNVNALEANSQVEVNDVNVGTVSRIDREGWHARVTVRINGNVNLPANATAKIGQISLLGTQHLELAAPIAEPATGRLRAGDTIPLARAGEYPTTEQTLAATSVVLNGGGLAQLQQINQQLNAALSGHEDEARGLIRQLETFTSSLNDQRQSIIAAVGGVDKLAGRLNSGSDVIDTALDKIPAALDVLAKDRDTLRTALLTIGDFATKTNRVVTQSKEDIVTNFRALKPTLRELAAAGPNLTKSLNELSTFPFPQPSLKKIVRGDALNLSATIDLTLGRLDNSLGIGTPLDGQLTALETMLGRTIDRQPSAATRNPLMNPIIRGGDGT